MTDFETLYRDLVAGVTALADEPVPCACGDNEASVRVADLRALLASSPAEGEGEDWEPGRDFANEFVYSTDQTLTEADVQAGQRVAQTLTHATHCNGRVMTDDGPECDCQPSAAPAPVSSGEAGCDNSTHVCSCGTIDHYHAGDCNIWLNDRPAPVAIPNTEGSEQA